MPCIENDENGQAYAKCNSEIHRWHDIYIKFGEIINYHWYSTRTKYM